MRARRVPASAFRPRRTESKLQLYIENKKNARGDGELKFTDVRGDGQLHIAELGKLGTDTAQPNAGSEFPRMKDSENQCGTSNYLH